MTGVQKPSVYYVVCCDLAYASFEDALAQAPDEIAAHVARSHELHARGTLLMAGAFLNNPTEPLHTMAICASREGAEEYLQGDPFVQKGLVKTWSIRQWANMFADRTRPGSASPGTSDREMPR